MDEKQARRVIQEANRRAATKARIIPEEVLFGPQLAMVRSEAKRVIGVCSRRAGKSYAIAYKLVEAGFHFPGSFPLYCTQGRAEAKNIVWPALLELNAKLNLGLEFKENTGDVVFPNKSRILLRGVGTMREIDKLRGPKYPFVAVDEAQAFGQNLKYLLQEVVDPATMDYEGAVWVTGTPNAACAGPFFEMATNHASRWDNHHWTLMDNPHLPNKEGWLRDKRAEMGWTEASAAYRREYLGEWVRDSEGLVYAFDRDRNTCPTFPKHLANDWSFVLGIDPGYNDPTAFVVWAYSMALGQVYAVESYQAEGLIPSQVERHLCQLEERYEFERIVMDTGGFGKGYAEELKDTYHRTITPARKVDKITRINFFNNDLRTGAMKICLDGNREYIEQMSLLQWDDRKMAGGLMQEDPRFPNDLTDSGLYGHQKCGHHALLYEHEPPDVGTPKYWEDWEKKQIAKLEGRQGESWWKKLRGR